MGLQVLDVNNENWNNIVKSFKNYGVHYLREYVEAFKNEGDGEPLLFYYESENTKAINVVMKRDIYQSGLFDGFITENKYFDLRTPYGYGGWIIDGANHQEVYDAYLSWCKENGIVAEFVRFGLFDDTSDYYGEVIPRNNNIVRSLDGNFEDILANFERRVRKDLKKTDELEIVIEKNENHLDDFLRIYYDTMQRNNAEEEYYFKKEFFNKIDSMSDNFIYFHVLLDGVVISTELVIMDDLNMYSYLGGTDPNYFSYHPNHFIKYHIIKWGNENGYKNFILGGGYGGSDDGIYLFKKGFAPEGVYQFYTGQKVLNQEVYNKLVEYRKSKGLVVEGNRFFPLYRAN